MTAAYNPHDYEDRRNWPLSNGQARKLRERNPAKYDEYERWLMQYENTQRATNRETWELSNQRLKERIDAQDAEIAQLYAYIGLVRTR